MNHIKKYSFLLIISVLLIACDDDDDEHRPANTPQPVARDDVVGAWDVSLFRDDGEDDTDDFDGLTFTFEEDGDLLISDGQQSTTAQWSINSAGDRMNIDISAANIADLSDRDELEDLDDDDWVVVESTDTTLQLREDDEDADDRDEVRFSKQ
ncbi:MAG: hypothetical protein ACFB0B_07395 [Thermonemataceae bacterium]